MEQIIKIKNLTKTYGKFKALDNLSFNVEKGQILGLLGPNGSGKTTTINCILSLLKFDKGSIKIFNKEMTPDSYDIKKEIGVVFQDVAVFNELTVYENIDYFCGLYIGDNNKRKEYIEDAIKLVGLSDFRGFKPKQLSGGLLRRLNIACGVAHKPNLIFLDEPTVAVDPQSRNNILESIKELRDKGATVIYTSHYMEEVEYLCDNIIIIDKGKILASGTNSELKRLSKVMEKVNVNVENIKDEHIEMLKANKNINDVYLNDNELFITYKRGKNNLTELIEFLNENKIKYNMVHSELPTLNDVFLDLTGKELRD